MKIENWKVVVLSVGTKSPHSVGDIIHVGYDGYNAVVTSVEAFEGGERPGPFAGVGRNTIPSWAVSDLCRSLQVIPRELVPPGESTNLELQ